MTAQFHKPNQNDHLGLIDNPKLHKLLLKQIGKKSIVPVETVEFSDYVIKINKRDKEQTRVLLITNQAIYNLKPNDYTTYKRRILISSLTAISLSVVSDEFIFHIPDEYDYRYKSNKKATISQLCAQLYKSLNTSSKLSLLSVIQSSLKSRTLTKQMARLQTRDELMRRKYILASEVHDSDNEEQAEIEKLHMKRRSQQQPSMIQADTSIQPPTQTIVCKLTQSINTSTIQPASTPVPIVEHIMTHVSNNDPNQIKLDDFELLRVLGRGSFGKVMQVRHRHTSHIYAMKILKKSSIVARNQVEHTKSERKILQSLNHPFLMTLRYAFQSAEKLYFVLDYYQGGELFFHLKQQRRFAEDTARYYVGEIACALGYLHSINVIYRDLKPENILLDEYGHVCLTDFGLSKDITLVDSSSNHRNTVTNKSADPLQAMTFCGTPEYLAPEIVCGTGHNKSVDWWSLGILLYELTVGIPPFYSQNLNEMYHKIQHGILRFPPFLSDSCKSLIIGLLNRDPNKRLGSQNDLLDIQQHAFFKSIDWNELLLKKYDMPYKPKIRAIDDVSNFDTTFTSEPVVDSMTNSSMITANNAVNTHHELNSHNSYTHHIQDSGVESFHDFGFNNITIGAQ